MIEHPHGICPVQTMILTICDDSSTRAGGNLSIDHLVVGAVSVIIPSKMRRAAMQFPQSDCQRRK
jgi:hypothetical protein